MQIDVRLALADGSQPPASDFASCLTLRDAVSGEALPAAVVPAPAEATFTLVLVAAGSSPAESERARAAAEAFIALRPSDERIALFRWGQDVVQLDTFLTDRERLRRQLAERLGTTAGERLGPELALAAVHDDVAELEDDAVAAVRSVVVVAPQLDLAAVPAAEPGDPVLALWLAHGFRPEALAAAPTANAFAADSQERVPGALSELSAHLDAAIAAGFQRIGYCGDGAEHDVLLDLAGDASDLTFRLDDNLAEELTGSCDAQQVAAGRRAYADTLAFTFTPDERTTYDKYVTMKLKDDFTASIQLAPELLPTPVIAHLHGEHSLDCARKSFTLDLDRNRGRPLIPRSSTDEYELIMTCEDAFYIHQITGERMLEELGLFPLRFWPVELTVDGASNGSYLLIEKYKEQLEHDFSRVRTIIRRRNDAWDYAPEVKLAAVDDATSLAEYERILPGALASFSGVELERVLLERMDLDGYLDWVALLTVLETGDYVDEMIFYGTETRDPSSGAPVTYFTPMGWDADGIFTDCHDLGSNAILDPNGLLYCAESDFDHFIFADLRIYARYVDALERAVAFATDERFAGALAFGKDLVYPLLERQSVRQANVEFQAWSPGAASHGDFVAAIDDEADRMSVRLRDSRTNLSARIARYRALHP